MTSTLLQKFTTSIREREKTRTADLDARTPHEVRQPGLVVHLLGHNAYLAQLQERQDWIAANCSSGYREGAHFDGEGKAVGRVFRFVDADEAFHFRMRF